MPYSTCCNAHTNYPEMGICRDCLDHCDWEEQDFEELEEDRNNEAKIDEILINTKTESYV